MKHLIIFFFCLCVPILAFAQEDDGYVGERREPVSIDGINYILDEKSLEAIVLNSNKWDGELSIPSEVTYNGQSYVVSSIEWHAFYECETLTKVCIPKTLTKFYTYSVYPIANMNPFCRCKNLVSIEVDKDNPEFCSVDGVLFTKDKKILCSYPIGVERTSYKVPESVEIITGHAFDSSENLVSIKIPESVGMIYNSAFLDCANLESINLPSNLKFITSWMFKGCKKLSSIDIPMSLTSIEESAFYGCSSLKVLDIPANVNAIGSFAFGKSNIEKLIIRGHISNNWLNKNIFYFMDYPTTIYVPSEEVDTYKGLYSGTVLSVEDFETTGIATPTVKRVSSALFDLSGRQIAVPNVKGIYIQNGKKYVVK